MEQKPETIQQKLSGNVHAASIVARINAAIPEPFLMFCPGQERYGFYGLAALGLMVFVAGNMNDLAVLYMAGAWVIATLINRLSVYARWLKGGKSHSLSPGEPWLLNLLGLGRLGWFGNVILCGVIGFFLTPVSVNVARLWYAGGIGMAWLGLISLVIANARKRAIIDEQFEMKWAAEQAKEI